MEADANPDRFQALPGAAEFIDAARSIRIWKSRSPPADGRKVHRSSCRWRESTPTVSPWPRHRTATAGPKSFNWPLERSNRTDLAAVYLGDGLWDLKAARELEFDFIGIGPEADRLLAAGANAVFPDFRDPLSVLNCIGNLNP